MWIQKRAGPKFQRPKYAPPHVAFLFAGRRGSETLATNPLLAPHPISPPPPICRLLASARPRSSAATSRLPLLTPPGLPARRSAARASAWSAPSATSTVQKLPCASARRRKSSSIRSANAERPSRCSGSCARGWWSSSEDDPRREDGSQIYGGEVRGQCWMEVLEAEAAEAGSPVPHDLVEVKKSVPAQGWKMESVLLNTRTAGSRSHLCCVRHGLGDVISSSSPDPAKVVPRVKLFCTAVRSTTLLQLLKAEGPTQPTRAPSDLNQPPTQRSCSWYDEKVKK